MAAPLHSTTSPSWPRTWPDGANIGVGCRAPGVVGLTWTGTTVDPTA